MRIFVSGGTGFVGSYLVPYLLNSDHQVKLLVRPGVRRARSVPKEVEVIEGNPLNAGPWWERLAECDAAINLVGEPIQGRWTGSKKARIRESRLKTLSHLTDAIPENRAFTLVNTSAVGIYGDSRERTLDESAALGRDFLATVARQWERAAKKAEAKGARVVITRLGLVLGPQGGVVNEIAKAMRRLTGGILGSGQQWVSWIHQHDVARAMLFCLENSELHGPVNLSSPNPIRQGDLARTLGTLLNRPAGLPAPAFAVRMAFGEFADVLLFSQKMTPKALLDDGFSFQYPNLKAALKEIIDRDHGLVRG